MKSPERLFVIIHQVEVFSAGGDHISFTGGARASLLVHGLSRARRPGGFNSVKTE